ncbi:MAG: hypothetical protein ACR65R_16100 [Methylomicrobium sp.]
MKAKSLNLNLHIVGLALLLGQSASYAMPGMEMPSGANTDSWHWTLSRITLDRRMWHRLETVAYR